MLLLFDAVGDDEGVDTAADGFSVTVAVINLRFVDVSDDKAVNGVNWDADDCDGKGVMGNDVDVVVFEFVVDKNGDDKTDVNVIDDVLSDDVDFNAENAADGVSVSADDINASADDDEDANVEITLAVVVAVTFANSESGSVFVDCEVDLESESEPEPERDRELDNAADGVSATADDVNGSADDDGAADVEITLESESGSKSEPESEPEPEPEPECEPECELECELEPLPRRYRRKPRRLCFGLGLR